MEIKLIHYDDLDNYFNMSDVRPEIEGDTLLVYSGEGTWRSWGKSSLQSTVLIHSDTLIVVHVSFHHKHGGGQGWHYFRINQEDGCLKVRANQLMDFERTQIAVVFREKNMPAWVKPPKVGA